MSGRFAIPDDDQMEDESFPPLPPPLSPGQHPFDGEEDGDLSKLADVPAPKRRMVKRPQPKLDSQRLVSERGLPALRTLFDNVRFKGKGHEAEDLRVIMQKMENWAHRLYPKLQFDDFMDKVEKLGSKKDVQTCLKRIRLDMPLLHDDFIGKDGEEEEMTPAVQHVFEDPDPFGGSGGFPGNSQGPVHSTPGPVRSAPAPVRPAPALTEEQRRRIELNKQLALERRLARKQQRTDLPDSQADSSQAVPSQADSSQADSSQAVSSQAVSSQAVSSQAVPSQAVSSQAVPSQAVPSQAVPSQAVSSQAVSSQAVPSQAVSSQAVPSQAVSSQAVSSQADSSQAVSSQAVSSQAVSSQAVPSQAVSSQAVPSQAVPSQAVPSQAVSSQAVSSQADSSQADSSQAVSSQAVSSQAIPSKASPVHQPASSPPREPCPPEPGLEEMEDMDLDVGPSTEHPDNATAKDSPARLLPQREEGEPGQLGS